MGLIGTATGEPLHDGMAAAPMAAFVETIDDAFDEQHMNAPAAERVMILELDNPQTFMSGAPWGMDTSLEIAARTDILPTDHVARNAGIAIEVEDLAAAVAYINGMFGGHNESSNIHFISADQRLDPHAYRWVGSPGTADIVRRVPIELFNLHMGEIRGLGRVMHETESTRTLRPALLHAISRRDAFTSEAERLLAYLENSETITEMTTISARIANVDLEILEAQRQIASVENAVNLPTVNIVIFERITEDEYPPWIAEPIGFGQELSEAFMNSLTVMAELMGHIGVLAAWLAVPVTIVAVTAGALRFARRLGAKPEHKHAKGDDTDEA